MDFTWTHYAYSELSRFISYFVSHKMSGKKLVAQLMSSQVQIQYLSLLSLLRIIYNRYRVGRYTTHSRLNSHNHRRNETYNQSIYSGVRVTRSLILCVCFVDRSLFLCTFNCIF
jgi:hypothetical protein